MRHSFCMWGPPLSWQLLQRILVTLRCVGVPRGVPLWHPRCAAARRPQPRAPQLPRRLPRLARNVHLAS
eukprot:8338284-Lingulodinium_polyedra.AAC.1